MIVVVMRKLRGSRSTACLSLYFTALAVSDQCLLTTAVSWYWGDITFTFPASFYRHDLLCTIPDFLWYTSSLTSAWFLVTMTYQRVTSVVAPHRVGILCTVRRGRMVIAFIVSVACALNFHFLFTRTYSSKYGFCISVDGYRTSVGRCLDVSENFSWKVPSENFSWKVPSENFSWKVPSENFSWKVPSENFSWKVPRCV
ncbi:hypothetical protein ACOMHN_012498 [Nucella lapillus]